MPSIGISQNLLVIFKFNLEILLTSDYRKRMIELGV